MTVTLNGKAMVDRPAAHSHLADQLDLPTYYGRNLDALYDVLTDIGEDTQIILEDPAAVVDNLGKYGEALLCTMQEAAEENPCLTITLQ